MRSQSTQSGEENLIRKPYRSPDVIIYGNIREITKTAGNMGNADGGASPMHKTQT
jgi:hypothetical protein